MCEKDTISNSKEQILLTNSANPNPKDSRSSCHQNNHHRNKNPKNKQKHLNIRQVNQNTTTKDPIFTQRNTTIQQEKQRFRTNVPKKVHHLEETSGALKIEDKENKENTASKASISDNKMQTQSCAHSPEPRIKSSGKQRWLKDLEEGLHLLSLIFFSLSFSPISTFKVSF